MLCRETCRKAHSATGALKNGGSCRTDCKNGEPMNSCTDVYKRQILYYVSDCIGQCTSNIIIICTIRCV